MKALLLILGLACSAYAGNITVAGPFVGLNSTDPSITIAEGESQDTLNVEVSKDALSLRKRKGYTSLSNLTTSTMPVTGSVSFKTSAGDNIKLFAQDSYVSKSVNGGAFTNLITSATVGAKYSFCVSDGKVYAFNDQQNIPWSYDGSAVTYYPSMPRASLCAMTVDRMLLAGTTDFPNRLYFSQSGGITNFTVDINPEDPGFESVGLPGEKITAIFATQTEWLVFKTNAFITYQGSNQFDLVRSVISERVGMIDPHAIVQNEGIVYFKAADGRMYGYTSGAITEISKKIEGIVTGVTRDEVYSPLYTNKSDFDSGQFYNTTSSETAGSITPLAYTYLDSTDIDFDEGSKDSSLSIDDSLNLYSRIWAANMGLEDGATTGWGINDPSAFAIAFNTTAATGFGVEYGTYSIRTTLGYYNSGLAFWIASSTSTSGTNSVYSVSHDLVRTPKYYNIDISTQADVGYYLHFHGYPADRVAYVGPFYKHNGLISVALWNTGIDYVYFDVAQYSSSGSFTSAVIENTASPTSMGYITYTASVPAGGQTDYFVAHSSVSTGIFTSFVATTQYLLLTSTDTAWKYKAVLYNDNTGHDVAIYDVSLIFKTTGYWETPEYSMGGMTSWGLFNAASTLDSAASLTYKIAVSTYAGGTANATLESLTPGALITASTGTYSKIRATNSFTTATETVRMDSLSYSWSRSPDKMANAFEYKGDVYFGVPYNNSLSNNRVLKFDTSSGGWNVFDIAENSPLSIDEYVYFGSPTGGYTYKYPVGDNDNGAAYNSYWKSKNYIGTNPYVEKQFERMSIIAGSDYGSSLDVTYTMDTSTSTTYNISLTSSTADFVRNNRQLPIGEIGAFFNLQFGNSGANDPWTFYGASIDYSDDPWRVLP